MFEYEQPGKMHGIEVISLIEKEFASRFTEFLHDPGGPKAIRLGGMVVPVQDYPEFTRQPSARIGYSCFPTHGRLKPRNRGLFNT